MKRIIQFQKSTVVTGLDCGPAKSLAAAKLVAMLARACDRRARKAGYDRNAEAVERKHHLLATGEQVITPCMKLQEVGTIGGQDVRYAPTITDGTTPPLVGHDRLLPRSSSIQQYLGDCWLEIQFRRE